MAWTLLAEYKSNSNPNITYRVAKNERGELGCDCPASVASGFLPSGLPAWRFHKGARKPCKHIIQLTSDNFEPGDAKLTEAGADWALEQVTRRMG